MNAQASAAAAKSEQQIVRRRLDAAGWGLLLVITGAALLLPDQHLAEIIWLIGVGLVLLGANVVRHLNGMTMATSNFVLGAVALAGGVAAIFGINLPLIPIVLILFGVSLLISVLFEKGR